MWAKHFGWTAYSETAGWDILLVNRDGVQLGVQAKMHLNIEVIDQAAPKLFERYDLSPGPDYRAVLVPKAEKGMAILQALGIGCFTPVDERGNYGRKLPDAPVSFHQQLPDFVSGKASVPDWELSYTLSGRTGQLTQPWHDWNPHARIALPEFVPDVIAGASGPVQLTKWKIGALKIAAILELRGYVTRADFQWAGISMSRWSQPPDYWLRPVEGKRGHWGALIPLPFPAQHPQVYPQVLEQVREHLASIPPALPVA